ncbi:zinc knuckle family protein [Stylonychia lemnae]|uniref:Zinc knuckle family protein n=1 Tax=Stylonychia lemnae TaxID=5949 RepID=A0A078AHA6_STYLE|nr:zinc knuckle family protein [Stylonychia lemnae]|eukprot:CDW81670.1 zinc knuckle family protein [Stylonychia lemnae]
MQSRATSEQLDIVDDCVEFFSTFNKLNQSEVRDVITQKYQNPDKKVSLPKAQAASRDEHKLKFLSEDQQIHHVPNNQTSSHQVDYKSKQKQLMMNEIGVSEEGFMNRPTERRGLGASGPSGGGGDLFDSFRNQRSKRYHVAAEERQRGVKEEQLCYICQQPGHFAKDCKFGID